MQYGLSKIRLRDHYLIFVDSENDDDEQKRFVLISTALRNIGARKATHRSFTLKRESTTTLNEVVDSFGLLLNSEDSIWIIYQDNDKISTVVVSRANNDPNEGITIIAS